MLTDENYRASNKKKSQCCCCFKRLFRHVWSQITLIYLVLLMLRFIEQVTGKNARWFLSQVTHQMCKILLFKCNISCSCWTTEVLEHPPSPSKKQARRALPSPGSKEFDGFLLVLFSYGAWCVLKFSRSDILLCRDKLDEILEERAK